MWQQRQDSAWHCRKGKMKKKKKKKEDNVSTLWNILGLFIDFIWKCVYAYVPQHLTDGPRSLTFIAFFHYVVLARSKGGLHDLHEWQRSSSSDDGKDEPTNGLKTCFQFSLHRALLLSIATNKSHRLRQSNFLIMLCVMGTVTLSIFLIIDS